VGLRDIGFVDENGMMVLEVDVDGDCAIKWGWSSELNRNTSFDEELRMCGIGSGGIDRDDIRLRSKDFTK
jgi:hypothetical protein